MPIIGIIASAKRAGAKATGGTITTDGTYWFHTFTSSGTFTPTQSLTADMVVVAGGGGGGGGGRGASGSTAGSGGGVGIFGFSGAGFGGASGTDGATGFSGSGGANGNRVSSTPLGAVYSTSNKSTPGLFGGGGCGADTTANEQDNGAGGAVRIIWGSGRAFPSTDTGPN